MSDDLYYYYFNYLGYYSYVTKTPVTSYVDTLVTTSYNGAIIGESFVAPRSGWLTSVNMYFTRIGASGDVTLAIVETSNGLPNLDRKLAHVTVNRSNLRAYPTPTNFPLSPIFVEAGKRYALVVITPGDHYVARVDANNFTQGTLFYGTDGAYFQGDLTKDLMFDLNMAQFAVPRTEVILQNVSLAGGITDLKIKAQQLVPAGASLNYEIQVLGKWYPLTDLQNLQNAPDIVPIRAVFLGTAEIAPAIQLAANVITASRPANALTGFSTLRTLAAPESHIQIVLSLVNFDPAKNTIDVKLVDNAGANPVTASSVSNKTIDPNGVAIGKVFTFNLGSARSTYKMKYIGTRTSDGPPFVIAERQDVAY